MSKQLIRSTVVAVGLALLLASAAGAEPEEARVGNLFLRDNGGISPQKLPRHRQLPISAHVNARIGTVDGSHPPAIEHVAVDFDETIQVHAEGLPVCRKDQLLARSTRDAKRACGRAIVGSGAGEVEVAFPEQAPLLATGPIVLFNGGVHAGATLLLIHTYVNVPAPTAVVVPVELTRIRHGHYGLRAEAEIPKIAGGAGSVTKFRFTIDRKFTHAGRKASYLTASCPTGVYYSDGEARFSDGTRLGVTHALPCTPEG